MPHPYTFDECKAFVRVYEKRLHPYFRDLMSWLIDKAEERPTCQVIRQALEAGDLRGAAAVYNIGHLSCTFCRRAIEGYSGHEAMPDVVAEPSQDKGTGAETTP